MEHIFEYYTLRLTTKSPVFVGSGQSFEKKEICLVKKTELLDIITDIAIRNHTVEILFVVNKVVSFSVRQKYGTV